MARRGPEPIGDILGQLMAKRGFARVHSTAALEEAWQKAGGALVGEHTRVGTVRRGTLEVTVVNSVLVQELTFQKTTLVRKLQELLPEEKIRDLRFRVGALS